MGFIKNDKDRYAFDVMLEIQRLVKEGVASGALKTALEVDSYIAGLIAQIKDKLEVKP